MKSPALNFRVEPNRELSMVRSGIGLMAGKGMAMGLGFAYWLFAARLYTADVVGTVAAGIAGVMLVSQLGVFGLESAIVSRYRDHEERRDELFSTVFTLVGIAALVVAAVAALAALSIDGDLAKVVRDGPLFAMYVGMSVVAAVGIVLDQASMALRRGDHVVSRNAMNGILSIVPLLGMWTLVSAGRGGAGALFGSWVFGATAGIALGAWQLARLKPRYLYRPRLRRRYAISLAKTAFPNYLLTVTERVPILVLPLLIAERISPQATAYWYAVWMVAWATLVIGRSMAFALFAEASRSSASMAHNTFKALRGSLSLGSALAAVTIIAAPWVLSLLGSDYADAGTAPLRILVFSFAPYSVIMAYFAVCRGTGRLREATVFGGLLAATIMSSATVATSSGLTRVAIAWSASVFVFGLVAGVRLFYIVRVRTRNTSAGVVLP